MEIQKESSGKRKIRSAMQKILFLMHISIRGKVSFITPFFPVLFYLILSTPIFPAGIQTNHIDIRRTSHAECIREPVRRYIKKDRIHAFYDSIRS